ncbi:isoprenoid synthase domain-containing protein [Mycena vulgaris]|nr:isoprenoid synthase domain-containing protein [Mycena vulgaris]
MSLADILAAVADRSSWSSGQESGILEPFTYVSARPGKGVRGGLLRAFNLWMNVPPEGMEIISKVVDMLHHASLILDDIEDSSALRRGRPAAHTIYGIPQTINAATYVHTLAYEELSHLNSTRLDYRELAVMMSAEIRCLHYGQGLDIVWRDTLRCPTEREYIGMVKNKTGGLLRLGVRLMMACSTTNIDVDYVTLVDLIGVHYQIRDDFLNLRSSDYSANKGFAEDIEEGKFSFPIVHSVHTDPSNRKILDVLQRRPTTPTLKTQVISYLECETRSFEYTVSVLDALEVEIGKEMLELSGNTELSKIISGLHVDGPSFK